MLLRNQSYEPGMAMPFTVSLANYEPQVVTSSIDCRSSSMLSPSPKLVEEEGTVKPSLHRSSTYRARSVSDLSRRRSTSSRSAFDSLPTSYDHGRKPSLPRVKARSVLPVSMDPRGATNDRTNYHHEDRDCTDCGSSETIGSLRTDGTAMKRPFDASWSRSHSCSLQDSVGSRGSNPWGLSTNTSVWERSFRSSQTSARTVPSLKAADCESRDVATHQLTNVAHGAEAIARQARPIRNGQESVTSSEGSANDQRRTPSVVNKKRLSPISGSIVATESPGRNSEPSRRSSEADLDQRTPDAPASQRVNTTIPAQSKDTRGTRTGISRQMSLEASAAYEGLRRQHCASLLSSEDTSHGDFLAAKNGCEQIFMPRPVLRIKTEEQILRQSYFLGSSQSAGSTFRNATFERNRRPPTGSNVDHEDTQDLSLVARHRPRSKSFPALLKPAHLGLTTVRRGSKDAVQPDLSQGDSQPHFSPAAELPSRASSLDVDELLQEREAFEAERLQWRVRQSHAFEFARSRRGSLANPPTSASSALFADADSRITRSGRELLRAGPRPQSKSRMPGRGSRMMHESLMVLAQEDRVPGRSTDVSEASRSPRPTLRKTKSSSALSEANVPSDRVRTKDASCSHGDFLNRFSKVLPQRLRPPRPESWLQRATTQNTGTAVSRTSECIETGTRLSASPEEVLSNSAASATCSAIAKRENTHRLNVETGQARLGKQRSATTSTGSVRHSSLQRAGSPPPRQFPPPNEPLPALPRLPEIYRSTTALSLRASKEASPTSRDTILTSPRQGSSPDKLVTSRRKPVPALPNEEPMLRSAEASGAATPANLAISHEAASRDAPATHRRTRSDISATNSIDFRPDSLLDPHRSSLENFGGGGGGIGLGEPEDAEHVKPVNEVEEVLEAAASA